jgi:hypothetical protein
MEKTNLQKLIEILNKNEVDYYTPENLVYNHVVIFNVEVWEDHLTYDGCDEDDKPLTDEVIIAELLKEVMIRYNEVSIWSLSEEEVTELTTQITWNSIYYSDYFNKFGVDSKVVSDFADGFLEDKEDELGSWDKVEEYLDNTDAKTKGRDFYYYIQSVEE